MAIINVSDGWFAVDTETSIIHLNDGEYEVDMSPEDLVALRDAIMQCEAFPIPMNKAFLRRCAQEIIDTCTHYVNFKGFGKPSPDEFQSVVERMLMVFLMYREEHER